MRVMNNSIIFWEIEKMLSTHLINKELKLKFESTFAYICFLVLDSF